MDYVKLFEIWYVLYYVSGPIFILIGVIRLLLHKRLCKNNKLRFLVISVIFILFGIGCLTIGPAYINNVVIYQKNLQ